MKKFNQFREDSLLEVLKASDPTGKWIDDFVHSDNPKFAGKSKKERIRMALGASYASKRNENVDEAANAAQQAAIAIAKKKKKEDMAEAKDEGEYDYEGAMAKTQLQTICRNAAELKDMLEEDENLPEWVQAKITKAEDYITTSLDYMKSSEELGEEVEELDELSKSTLAAYAKGASRSAGIQRKIAADFENKGIRAKSPGMKQASAKLSQDYKEKSWKRQNNVNKAIDRLAKEEVEPIEELNKDTVYSYNKKAEADQDKQFTKIGKALKDNDPKTGNEAGHKFIQRSLGITRAEKRLNKEDTEVAEARMSAAQRLWNAENKQRAKSDASLARTPSSIPKPEEKK